MVWKKKHSKDTKWYENCSHKALKKLFSENISTIPGCTKNCSLKHMHNTGEYEKLFSETYAQYEFIFPKVESWGPGVIPGKWGRRRSSRRVVQIQGIPRGTAAKAILESWCYTRRNGAALIQAESCSIPGSSRRRNVWLNSRAAATSRSTPVGSKRRWCDSQSVVYTRVAWATANTKSNPALFVYNRSLPVFVYTRSRPRFLFIPGHY